MPWCLSACAGTEAGEPREHTQPSTATLVPWACKHRKSCEAQGSSLLAGGLGLEQSPSWQLEAAADLGCLQPPSLLPAGHGQQSWGAARGFPAPPA